jgi:peptidoglycan/xylan/chitin deacetylase (PgdA/CDA1 family)
VGGPPRSGVPRESRSLVLCYHAVSDGWNVPLAVTTAQLRAQLELLVERGYRGVTFYEAVTAPPPGRSVAITFDDGFASVLERAFPIMSSLELVATVFIVTDYVDAGRTFDWFEYKAWRGVEESEIRSLSWTEIDQLAAAGWEIGSHTRTHPRLPQVDDEALAAELRGSREACERRLGSRCRSLAYPFGDVDDRVVEATRAAGYEAAASLPVGVQGGDTLHWPRTGVYRRDTLRRFRLKISPTVFRLRRTLAPVEKFVRA